ncbi:hypothetical protein [Cryobacterium mannosilyticum]|uniref:TolB family protein n=1 Tax=Cryobacterium mannosilyticum TaxID=1259190 RepID=UPI0030B9E320
MKASDLPLLKSVSDPTIHPERGRAVVSVIRPEFSADDYVGQLWTVSLQGKPQPRLLTRGHRDSAPRFSPDGRLLAFLRSGPGAPAQLHVVAATGGGPVQATAEVLGVTDFRWRPDSAALAYIARVPEPGRLGTVPGLAAEAEPPRIITTLHYRANAIGYTTDRRAHVFLVPAPDPGADPVPGAVPATPESTEDAPTLAAPGGPALPPGAVAPRRLTTGDFEHEGIAFSPDGMALLTISARHPGRDEDLRSELLVITLDPVGAGPELPARTVLS